MIYLPLIPIAFLAAKVSFAGDYSDPNWKNVDPEIKELCQNLEMQKIPKEDQPPSSSSEIYKNCEAQDFYYGIGRDKDFNKARHCAFINQDSKVLMMIYANGFGVPQNTDFAIRFACEMGGSSSEISGRIHHLQDVKRSQNKEPNFDYCDDITSGLMQGWCARKDERILADKRSKDLRSLISSWTPSEQKAFETLQAASDKFTNDRSRNEIDLSGSARSAFVIAEEGIQKEDFFQSLMALEQGKAKKYSKSDFQNEDKKLNELYKKIMAKEVNSYEWGSVDKDSIKKTQLTWIKYRDAWMEFAKLKYPKYGSNSIGAWFTKKRNHMLRSLN